MHPAPVPGFRRLLRFDDDVDRAHRVDERPRGHLVDLPTPRAQELAKPGFGGVSAVVHRSSQVTRGSAPNGGNYSVSSVKSTLRYDRAIIPTRRGDPLAEEPPGAHGHPHLGQR